MRKTIRNYGLAVLLCCLCVLLTACGRKYTVTFDLNGGTLLSGELVQTVEEGQSAAAPQAELDNYRLSWDRNFSAITGDTVVTAKWIPIRYKVSFDLNGGELISGKTEQVVAAGSAAEAPEAVNGDLQLSWDKDFSKITGDTVVTARWEKLKMDKNMEEMTQYVQERTVRLHVKRVDGSEADGTGIFIDENGTIATTWYVIRGATKITAVDNDGGKFTVSEIVDFSQGLNLAILKIDARECSYLKLSDELVRYGETVYTFNASVKALNAVEVCDKDLKLGIKEYLALDTVFSGDDAGTPIVNQYGEVVGLGSAVYNSDSLAIKIGLLESLNRDKNWTVQEFGSWYEDEMARSYRAWDGEKYYITTVNTYQAVTNRECVFSHSGEEYTEGYVEDSETYAYTYDVDERDQYIMYLEEKGFHCYTSAAIDKAVVMFYSNENEGFRIELAVLSVPNEADLLGITVRTIS